MAKDPTSSAVPSVRQSLANSTVGIIFLGTPHWGSVYTMFGKVICALNFWLDSSSRLLDQIAPDFWQHQDLNEDFKKGYGVKSIYNCVEGQKEYFGPFPITEVCADLKNKESCS
jgi:hypothetical protein